ncbi:hypothetical protein CBR_g22156 [Chara braunii]|uniref:Uncharacterized protein n=1 Tax=Chara braunii TaxID=69332 RepID=A0A388L2C0_CHABU|nr:hypothetical protein CBR_g22156 [Chara braunii]|eukprot:GBG76408.1 hypothetical protein CBR_g22156 [Chara braunii]
MIDPMYQYSLAWFINLFVLSVAGSSRAATVNQRLEHIHKHFTYSLYCNVCRSLFEKDKLLFGFLLTTRILGGRGLVDKDELTFLVMGSIGGPGEYKNPAKDWLSDKQWEEVCHLARLPGFSGLALSIPTHERDWREISIGPEPQRIRFPKPYDKLSSFQKLLIVRCIRPDKVASALQDFVVEIMGRQFVEHPAVSLAACYAESSPNCPLLFVLSSGSDPTSGLLQFAYERDMSDKIYPISLGQGQGPKAAAIIADAVLAGAWVLLQNCHLAPSWMPSLENLTENINPETVHPDFRLWMTSYPSSKFPVSILQSSVKMTNEPPKGLRNNMRRSFGLDPVASDEFFETSKRPKSFKALLFGLCFLHAVVQERRRFGPLGWNIPYSFDDGDFRISARQLKMFIDDAATMYNDENTVKDNNGLLQDSRDYRDSDSENPEHMSRELPLEALRYVTGECNYGGRVTDDRDRTLLHTILRRVYCLDILRPNYRLSESGIYYVPSAGSRESYIEYVQTLPLVADPEAFGLHPNANISKDMHDTSQLLGSMLVITAAYDGNRPGINPAGKGTKLAKPASIQRGGKGLAGTIEDNVVQLARDILNKLPQNFDLEACQKKFPILYEESMNTTLCQEMSRYNRLLNVARTSLQLLAKALQGLVLMSTDLETTYRRLTLNQVPQVWLKVSYPSLKPLGSYVTDLLARLQALQTWYERGRPAVHWISGFFFAQSFLTATLQNYARKYKIPIDTVGFDSEMLDMDHNNYPVGPEEGVYIRGLHCEGCSWDEHTKMLCESKLGRLYASAPVMWLKPVPARDLHTRHCYDCPVYRTTERKGILATTGHSTNFLTSIRIPTDKPASHWIMRGAALIAALSD